MEIVSARSLISDHVGGSEKRLQDVPDYGNARAVQNLIEHLTAIKAVEYEKSRKLNMNVSEEQIRQAFVLNI